MRRTALGKHRWSLVPGLLLCITAAGPIYAAPERPSTLIAIGNPLPNSLVAGRISLSVAYNHGMGRITALTVFVDDHIQYSRNVLGMDLRGVQYLDLDTRTIADGNHTVKVVAMGTRGPLAIDEVGVTVRNGIAGGVDLVPPLVQLKSLQDGDTVSGKLSLDILAEDNSGMDLLVSVFVNRTPRLIKNRPPYTLELNTSEFLDPVTKRGSLLLEAWAYDKANNLGKSRQLKLNVVAPGKENETRKQDDPSQTPVVSPPMVPDTAIKGAPTPMGAELIIPLPTGSKDSQPTVPPVVTNGAGGRPLIQPGVKTPGDKPATTTSQAAPGIKAPSAQSGGAGAGSLAGAKSTTPAESRPQGKAASVQGGVVAPKLVTTKGASSALSGPRAATPKAPRVTVKPVPASKPVVQAPAVKTTAPVRIAQAKPFNPEIAPVKPTPPKRLTEIATAKIEVTMPEMIDAPASEARIEPAAPMISRGGPREKLPAQVRNPKVPKSPGLYVVTLDRRNLDKQGRPKMETFKLSDVPADRKHRLTKGETLHQVARKYGVTVRSVLVANGLADGRGLRSGSILKVPGSFDVVVNNKRVAFDVPPRIENGLPITPFRQIMEYAGGVVVWDAEKQEVNAANDQSAIKIKIGSNEALVNQTVIVMDREAFLDSGRTMVPISFMEKALELKAEYDVKSGTIMLVRR
ncbi:MAG: stalk domain-containing protein [Actinomycetota bacterium]